MCYQTPFAVIKSIIAYKNILWGGSLTHKNNPAYFAAIAVYLSNEIV